MTAKELTIPTNIDLSTPASLIEFAKTLKSFIVNQKLYVQIQGKNYVEVEGWEFAGACMGVFPVPVSVERVESDIEIKYRATVELVRLADGSKVGGGVAICSNKERGRDKQDEYVIASMAQTRAIGKAYRNSFAWLMKMAGYEVVPAEEMNGTNVANLTPETIKRIKEATSDEALSVILADLEPEEKKAATALVQARSKEISDGSA